jgi:serine/threonine protein kinase/tetratricopeptide (TPR) repeat protein
MSLAKGTRIGSYEILASIGAGGMGEVYRARDVKLNRQVAIKVLLPDLLTDPTRRRQFLIEARAAAAINHPNVATIYTVGEADAGPFIAMELVDGKTLRALLGERRLPIAQALRLLAEIAAGMAKAHESNVVHRDLKPENILVTTDNHAKILDFGVARVIPRAGDSMAEPDLVETRSMSRQDVIVGTLTHMSPEQARGESVDARSDIFSFGVILYEMVTGQLPFRGRSRVDILAAILNVEAVPPSRIVPEVPVELDRFVAKCLEKDPGARFQHTDDLIVDLRKLQETKPADQAPPFAGRGASAGSASERRKRIVVLPFENLGPPDDEFFASGMTEEIISRLAGVTGLGVISRTTAMQYDKSGKTIKRIGEELGVDFVLEGTVRWARGAGRASRVRITPQLIRVSDDTHVWASRYERVIDDIFQVQTDIAEHVTEQLDINLLQAEREELHTAPTRNLEAYQAYLKGLYYERPRGFLEERDRLAVQMFQQAVELDPDFALAHAELAVAHAALYHYGFDHSEERRSMAAGAVEQAVRLRPDSPRVRLALGYYYYWCRRDYARAIEELTAAERGLPGNSEVLAATGFVRRRQGMWEAALKHFEKAVELNPMDTHFAIQLADTFLAVGRFSEAETQYDLSIRFLPDQFAAHVAKANLRWLWSGDLGGARTALEAMPEAGRNSSFGFIHWFWQEIFEGKYGEAASRASRIPESAVNAATKNLLIGQACSLLSESERARTAYDAAQVAFANESRAQPANQWLHASLGIVYAGLGRSEEAIREGTKASELCPLSADPMDGPAFLKNLALIMTMVGDYEGALEAIERLLSHRVISNVEYLPLFPSGFSLPLLRLDPRWKPLWEYPRFQEMIESRAGTEPPAASPLHAARRS